jgi:hypothetical protein
MLAEGITLSEQVDLRGAAPATRRIRSLLSSAPIRLNPVYKRTVCTAPPSRAVPIATEASEEP